MATRTQTYRVNDVTVFGMDLRYGSNFFASLKRLEKLYRRIIIIESSVNCM